MPKTGGMPFDFTAEVVLEDPRTRLSPLKVEHAEALALVIEQAPDLMRYSPSHFADAAGLREYITQALTARARQERYPWVIWDKQAQRYVGSTSYGAVSNLHRRLEIGWTWLDPAVQRTGLNRHNKYLMLHYAFETLGFARVELKTDGRNQQSRQAMEAMGATYEGALRSHTIMADGYRRDTAYYSILAEEWPAVKQQHFARQSAG